MARTPYDDPLAEKTFKTNEREYASYIMSGKIPSGKAHVLGSEITRQNADANSEVDTFNSRWNAMHDRR